MFNYLKHGTAPKTVRAFNELFDIAALPTIRGQWYWVDPTSGSNSKSGKSPEKPVASLSYAYSLCTSGAGDGIVLMSAGTSTAGTTSYIDQEIAWSKHGITVVGIAAPVQMFGRARVANKTRTTGAIATIAFPTATTITDSAAGFLTAGFAVGQTIYIDTTSNTNDGSAIITAVTAGTITCAASTFTPETAASAGSTTIVSYCVDLITVSGNNNTFINVHFYNGGSNALEIGGIEVSGARNAFINCNIAGGVGAAAAATKYSLKLTAAEENTFYGCVIGVDTFDHGNNADTEVLLSGAVARNKFIDCEFVSYVGSGTAHAAVSSSTTTGGRATMFKNCLFNSLASVTTPAAVHITSGACDKVGFNNCKAFNFTAWGGYADMPATAASAGGGLATTA